MLADLYPAIMLTLCVTIAALSLVLTILERRLRRRFAPAARAATHRSSRLRAGSAPLPWRSAPSLRSTLN